MKEKEKMRKEKRNQKTETAKDRKDWLYMGRSDN